MKNVINILNELKDKGLLKDYALGGAIAALRWIEPFFTRVLDVFIILSEKEERGVIALTPIYEYLKNKGYDKWIGQWLVIEDIPVEFIPAEGLSREALENAVEVEYKGAVTKVMKPEYLIALFLKASRQKDKIMVQMLLEQAKVDIGELKEILNRYGLIKKFKSFEKNE